MLGENTYNAYDINEAGQAVGHDGTGSWGQAFIWQNGVLNDLGSLDWGGSCANAVNDRGQVVGYLINTYDVLHPFIWQNGVMAKLETLGGWYAEATNVNDFGQVLGGTFYDRLSDRHPCIWIDGVITDLKGIGFDSVSDINDLGQVIGMSNNHAVIWNTRKIVGVDITPGKRSNTINLKGRGAVSVAVLGSATFDATMVDPATASLAGATVMLDENGKYLYQDRDVNGDGMLDRVFMVYANQVLLTRYDTVAVLQGKTYDDTPISGWDYVNVR